MHVFSKSDIFSIMIFFCCLFTMIAPRIPVILMLFLFNSSQTSLVIYFWPFVFHFQMLSIDFIHLIMQILILTSSTITALLRPSCEFYILCTKFLSFIISVCIFFYFCSHIILLVVCSIVSMGSLNIIIIFSLKSLCRSYNLLLLAESSGLPSLFTKYENSYGLLLCCDFYTSDSLCVLLYR